MSPRLRTILCILCVQFAAAGAIVLLHTRPLKMEHTRQFDRSTQAIARQWQLMRGVSDDPVQLTNRLQSLADGVRRQTNAQYVGIFVDGKINVQSGKTSSATTGPFAAFHRSVAEVALRNGSRGNLVVEYPLPDVRYSFVAMIVLMAATSAIGTVYYFERRSIDRTLQEIAKAADRVSAGELGCQIEVSPTRADPASEAFNRMSAALALVAAHQRQSEERLRKMHQEHETWSRERTAELALINHQLTNEIAERQKFQEQLEESHATAEAANRAKSVFLANMSHELRTPLNAIIGFTDLMLNGRTGELQVKQAEYLHIVSKSAVNLLTLIDEVLDLSRIDAGHARLRLTRFSLRSAVQEVAEALSLEAKSRGIAIQMDVAAEIQAIGDERQIRQVISNLISNALKFTPDGGRVSLFARVETDETGKESLVTSVADTGVGIDADDQSLVFDEFYQVEQTYTRRFKGAGLGLALAKRIVELHGGSIWVDSEPGSGSCFSFRIPHHLAPIEATPEPKVREESPVSPPGAGKMALVIEDNPSSRALVCEAMSMGGFMVLEAATGSAGVELAAERRPDVILLDIQLPDIDGLDVLARLRRDPVTANIPVIAVTAYNMPGDSQRFIEAGCRGCIPKPIEVERLSTDVSRILIQHPGH